MDLQANYTAAVHGDTVQASRDELIQHYFEGGYTALEILSFLHSLHHIKLSLRQYRRIAKRLGLHRRKEDELERIVTAVEYELSRSGRCLGYRSMWHRLRTCHNINVYRETVREVLHMLDAEGIEARRSHRLRRRVYTSKGPNYCIHVDGYDKLKPYGFSIHGAIDGFSRRVLWLRVGRTNNKPSVIAGYFVDYVKEIEGVPRMVRIDAGTENGLLEDIQKACRWNGTDDMAGEQSVLCGRSVANQRIERWWRDLRTSNAQFWIDLFRDMEDSHALCRSNDLQVECLRFCFTELIQSELNEVQKQWNQHRIRPSTAAECPPGKPDVLFFLPGMFDAVSYKCPVDMNDLQAVDDSLVEYYDKCGTTPEYKLLFQREMAREHLSMPHIPDEALELYAKLLDLLHVA